MHRVRQLAPAARSRGRAVLVLALLAAVCAPAPGRARADAFAGCFEQVLVAAKSHGAKAFGRPRDAFLIAPDTHVSEYTLPADGCLGFVVAGRRHSQAVWLTLYRDDGQILADQTDPGVYGYARACGARGERVVAELRMHDGSGEVRLLAMWSAPAQLAELGSIMSACRGVGMPRPPVVDVGPEPLGLSLSANLERLSQRLAKRGYQRLGEPAQGHLPNMRRDIRRLALDGGRCYALAAIGGPDVGDIDLRVFESEEAPRLLASEAVRSAEAIVRLCVDGDADHLVDVRMYEGGGNYLLQAYELPRPHTPPPPGASGHTLIGLKETEVRFEARGMRVRDTLWLMLPAHDEQRVPMRLSEGVCYGFALIPSSDPERRELELSVTDRAGNLLASNASADEAPLAYACASEAGLHAVIARAPSAARPVQALLVVAQDAEPRVEEVP